MTTATKIRLSDGRYCYSGPNCTWHSPLGIAGIRKELATAQKQIASAKTLEEFTAAADKLKDASSRYDATDEGLEILKKAIQDETDPKEKASLRDRKKIALSRASEVEAKKVSQKNSGFVGFDWDNHVYDVPGFTEVEPESMYSSIKGSKHTGYRNVTEIAKDVRDDLKKAQRDGYIPSDLKYRVTIDKFSGGQSIRIQVQGVRDSDHYFDEESTWGSTVLKETPAVRTLNLRLKSIMDAYNHQSHHPEIDYSSATFYSRVEIEDERQAKWRESEANVRRQRAAGKQVVAQTAVDVRKAGGLDNFLRIANYEASHSLKGSTSIKFGRIPGTDIIVIESEPYQGVDRKEVFDFSAVDTNGRTLEDAISLYNMRELRRAFGKRKINL